MNKFKVLELFGGIGACSKAFDKLKIEYDIVDYVEIDKYAVKSFNAIHNTNFEPQDICNWNKKLNVDLIMHGSPCQDFSLSGKQSGGDEGSGTRSSLMYETLRIVSDLKPKYVIWENVKNLLSKKHRHNFENYIKTMETLGYKNYYQVLNAKDYGIPQNRERVFTISIRNDIEKSFVFPEKQELKLTLKDMLENDVDEKYYLSDRMINYITNDNDKWTGNNNKSLINKDIASTINTGEGHRRCDSSNYVSSNFGANYNLKQLIKDSVYSNLEEKLFTKDGNIKRYINSNVIDKFNEGQMATTSFPNGYGHGSRTHDLSIALNTIDKPSVKQNLRIRKLTPKECWRLMGFDDEDYEKASKFNSNAQLYKQSGNSIVVNILVEILKNLL